GTAEPPRAGAPAVRPPPQPSPASGGGSRARAEPSGSRCPISSLHASDEPLPLGLVAAGLRQPGSRSGRHAPARPADGAVRAAVRVRGGARIGAAAPPAARGSALWPDDPRL